MQVVPGYKKSNHGDPVYYGVGFILKSMSSNVFLHSSTLHASKLQTELRLSHQYVASIREINGSTFKGTHFSAKLYKQAAQIPDGLLFGGAVCTIYHTEMEALMVFRAEAAVTQVITNHI